MMVTMATDNTDPTVHDVSFYTEHRAYIELTNSRERMLPSYRNGKFRPENVRLSWVRASPSASWKLTTCKVSGPMVKKDDTDSLNAASRDFAGYVRLAVEMPSWLSSMIDTYSTTLPD